MTQPIAIYGAGGLGREVLSLIRGMPEWHVIGFFDDGLKQGTYINDVVVLGNRDTVLNWSEALHIVLAVGSPEIKIGLSSFLKNSHHLSYPSLVHPRATIMDPGSVLLGEGAIITAGCVITTNVQIGKHVLINLNTTIGHDTRVADYASIMPGVNLAGEVTINQGALVGSGANILNRVTIGKGAIVGAGAVVICNIADYETAVGVPAKARINKR